MRNKSYALLISGIFGLVLMPSTSALEGAYPGSYSWRPVAAKDAPSTNENVFSHGAGQNLRAGSDPRAWGHNYAWQRSQSYSFRPWDERRARVGGPTPVRMPATAQPVYDRPYEGYRASQSAAIPQPGYRGAAIPAINTGRPGYGFNDQYRFRPMDPQQHKGGSAYEWTYRPAQIDIPNHYVYRPLKVPNSRQAVHQQPKPMAAMPGMSDYAYAYQGPVLYGYQPPSRIPMADMAVPGYGANDYLDPYRRYTLNRPAARWGYPWQGEAVENQRPWGRSAPRYTGQSPYPPGHRFRPVRRPGWGGYGYVPQADRYATNPYPLPNYQHSLPGRAPYNAGMPGWQPYAAMHYPGMRRPGAPNRYGVDWYDGMGDGEGAWYQLAGQQTWPRVSQHLPLD